MIRFIAGGAQRYGSGEAADGAAAPLPGSFRAHVAVVEDDAALRDATATLLKDLGFQVSAYPDGRSFLAAAPLDELSCVLLDVQMPRMDGLAVLTRLQERRHAPPVIMLTGHVDVPLAVRAMRAGALNLLQKPYGPEALHDAVREAVARSIRVEMGDSAREEARRLIAGLAPRQRQIMAGLIKGHQNKTIASVLGLSVRTVEAHRRVVMRKLNARSLSDVLHRALIAELPIVDIDYDGRWTAVIEEQSPQPARRGSSPGSMAS